MSVKYYYMILFAIRNQNLVVVVAVLELIRISACTFFLCLNFCVFMILFHFAEIETNPEGLHELMKNISSNLSIIKQKCYDEAFLITSPKRSALIDFSALFRRRANSKLSRGNAQRKHDDDDDSTDIRR